ncbi:Ankyrin repeat-containing domain protein [Rhypophila decipiens]
MAEILPRLHPEGEERLLRLAIENGYGAASQHFVKKGLDTNPRDCSGNTPLHLAAQRGSQATIQLLHNLGADIERRNHYGETPLCCALKGGHEVSARMLCDKGANINGEPGSVTPLMSAVGAKQGGEAVVKFILRKLESTSINSTDSHGNTALHYCAFSGKATTLELLVDQGAAIDHRNQYHLTPLFVAVIRGNKYMVKRLLEYGADLEATYDIGQTPLVVAIRMRRRRIVRILLDNGASFDTTDKNGETPLHIAVWSKEDARYWASKYHSMLGSYLPHMHETMPFGNTAGTEEDGGEILQMVLERGADTEARSRGGCTPLHFAACVASAGLMKLINFGANVNVRDHMGHTPLIKAVLAGLEHDVRLLLSSGPDVDAVDNEGKTALSRTRDINRRSRHEGVIHLLKSHGAKT